MDPTVFFIVLTTLYGVLYFFDRFFKVCSYLIYSCVFELINELLLNKELHALSIRCLSPQHRTEHQLYDPTLAFQR